MHDHIWFPFYQAQIEGEPLKITKAKDSLLFDANGKSYIDVNSSWWVNVHGHGRPEIKEAIQEQFDQIDHVIFSAVSHEPAELLSQKIVQLLGSPFSKVFFSDDGSTSTEVALKMAIQFFANQGIKKTKIVALEGAYHGDTFGAMSAGQRDYFNRPFEPYFFDVTFLPFPSEENWEKCRNMALELAKEEDVVALIVEPLVQGSSGMKMYSAAYLDELVRIFRQSEALVIFDEIMTGWGRLGTYFAMNHCSEKPDIICLSKGLTGGVLPLGLTVTTNRIFNAFDHPDKAKALLHGHSFTGNPLACAAALANLTIFSQQETWRNIERIGKKMESFRRYLESEQLYHNPRVFGTIFAVDMVPESSYFNALRDNLYHFFLSKGILCRPLGSTVFFNPPYVTTDEQLDYCFEALLEAKKFLEVKS